MSIEHKVGDLVLGYYYSYGGEQEKENLGIIIKVDEPGLYLVEWIGRDQYIKQWYDRKGIAIYTNAYERAYGNIYRL